MGQQLLSIAEDEAVAQEPRVGKSVIGIARVRDYPLESEREEVSLILQHASGVTLCSSKFAHSQPAAGSGNRHLLRKVPETQRTIVSRDWSRLQSHSAMLSRKFFTPIG